jgi:hypothetical protein
VRYAMNEARCLIGDTYVRACRGTVEAIVQRRQSETFPSILHVFVLQRVDGLCQLSQGKWINSVFTRLEVDDCGTWQLRTGEKDLW